MKIYYQYSTAKTLPPTGGDYISTICLLTAMSRFAVVYYSGQEFLPCVVGHGLREYPGSIEDNIPDDCDLYFVRADKSVFQRVPGPKVWYNRPYDVDCYREALFVTARTQCTADLFLKGVQHKALNPQGLKFENVVSLGQTVGANFKPLQSVPKVQQLRKKFGGRFIIGHFGRLESWSGNKTGYYPFALSSAWLRLVRKYPDSRLVVGTAGKGKLDKVLPNTVVCGAIPYEEMPYYYAACDVVVIDEYFPACATHGSLKVKEPATCGVPVILRRTEGKVEELGSDYPLFVSPKDAENGIVQQLERVVRFKSLRRSVSSYLVERMKRFSVDESAHSVESVCKRFLKERLDEN